MKPIYWENIHSCLDELRFDGSTRFLLPQHTDLSTYRMCGRGQRCLFNSSYATLYEEDLKFDDYRIRPSRKDVEDMVVRLMEMELLGENEGWDEFYHHLIRVFYNPSPQLMTTILKERARIGPKTNQIGAHVRCGGALADSVERTSMVTPEILATVPDEITRLVNTSHVPENDVYLYLSTDSTIAYRNISEALYPMRVVTTDLYHRGHTTTNRVETQAIKRAYIDLYLMSESQRLLLSSHSSFSRIIRWMSGAENVTYIQAPYSFGEAKYRSQVNRPVSRTHIK